MNEQDEIYASFTVALEELIKLNWINRQRFKEYRKMHSCSQWSEEFCTVKIDNGRQVGKSTFVKNHYRLGDVVIVPNTSIAREYNRENIRNVFTVNQVEALYHTNQYGIKNGYCDRSINPSHIWIDDANLKPSDVIMMYETFSRYGMEQTFIFLGK